MNTIMAVEAPGGEVHSALKEAETALDGRPGLARLLGVTTSAIGNWRVRGVPAKACVRIEALVPTVTRQRLRPTDYWEIWPDLPPPAQNADHRKAA